MARATAAALADIDAMQRVLLVGSRRIFLHTLASLFTARGGSVLVSTTEEETREAVLVFVPHVVVWDYEAGGAALDPAEAGFEGPTVVLTRNLASLRQRAPLRRYLLKPVSADDVVGAVQSRWCHPEVEPLSGRTALGHPDETA
jgi:hypothetical protein